MKQTTSTTALLTKHEQQKRYGLPRYSAKQRTEYFTLNSDELKILRKHTVSSALYFAVNLVIFKLRQTFIPIEQSEVKADIEHLLQRYFPDESYEQLQWPKAAKTRTRIENKILSLCGYARCRGDVLVHLTKRLAQLAPHHPKQRALCKAAFDICHDEKIAIPSLTTLSRLIREVYKREQTRVYRAYYRHTQAAQRRQLLTLLEKGDQNYRIVELRQEMKSFAKQALDKTRAQHALLAPLFSIAKTVAPKLQIPSGTVDYYASLIDYYNGTRLVNLDKQAVQIYLLCYVFMRFLNLNDGLLEALKKIVLQYDNFANAKMKSASTDHIEASFELRQRVSELLLAIKRSTHKKHVLKSALFCHVPEAELEGAALALIDDKLDPQYLYWKAIDEKAGSIAQHARPLFLALDLVVERHDVLARAETYLRKLLTTKRKDTCVPLPAFLAQDLPEHVKPYLIIDERLHCDRFEFWVYLQLCQQIASNKLTLQHTLKYKPIDAYIMSDKTWNKEKPRILKALPYQRLRQKPKKLLDEIMDINHSLYQQVNQAIDTGDNSDVIQSETDASKWSLRPLEENHPPIDTLFSQVPTTSIVDIMALVDKQLNFTHLFESIMPKGAKQSRDPIYIRGGILAQALNLSSQGLAEISDLKVSTLLSVEQGCIRMETINAALHLLYDAANALPIFNEWNIAAVRHGSLDGLKLNVQHPHHRARYSPKYLGLEPGLSSYNFILNHFPIVGRLIGANEYEGHFAFELCQFQKRAASSLERVSTDKHGTNSLNFLLFYLTDTAFAPRIPKVHHETFWGVGTSKHYKDMLIKPSKFINEQLIIDEWDTVQRTVASMLTGDTNPSILIQKLASPKYNSPTKRAFVHINQLLKSNFMLQYVHDKTFRHAIEQALNRGEAFNRLYRAIALLNKGQLRGLTYVEMMISDACTRLLAAIILYYNSTLLNALYETTADETMKSYLRRVAPMAWTHINLLGHYQFQGKSLKALPTRLAQWDWQKIQDLAKMSEPEFV